MTEKEISQYVVVELMDYLREVEGSDLPEETKQLIKECGGKALKKFLDTPIDKLLEESLAHLPSYCLLKYRFRES